MTDEEEITARLLRLGGPRPAAPSDRASRVRTAVHGHWRSETRRRRFRGRAVTGISLLAAAATVIFIVRGRAVPKTSSTIDAVASIEHVIDRAGASQLRKGRSIQPGEWVDTGTARIGLRLPDGTSIRLDTATRARLLSRSIVELAQGGVYVDTGTSSTGLEVRTPLGVARDIGTQFEIRLTDAAFRVRVRSGLVQIRNAEREVSARPGTEVTLTPGDAVTRPIAAFGQEWEWAHRLAPAFDAEGRPLATFLEHISREQGWALRYGDRQLAREASGIILHGTLRDLEPRDAVAVAVRTSGLSYSLEDGELVVMRPSTRK